MADLEAVHEVADLMRIHRMVHCKPGRFAEDLRWADVTRLRGGNADAAAFLLLGFRSGAGPGVFTEGEVRAAEAAATAAAAAAAPT